MKAIVVTSPGGPEVLQPQEVPSPDPGPEELLVDVVATAVNRADVLLRKGMYASAETSAEREAEILGLEFSGRVSAVGRRVREFGVGDFVMGLVAGGGYAQRLVVHERVAMRIPRGTSPTDAAAIPEVWITAFDALVCQGGLTSGRTALVHGGGSGVGTAAIGLVKALGGSVVCTSSAGKVERCLGLGADLALDYADGSFVEEVGRFTSGRGVDVVLDVLGGKYLKDNLAAVRSGGRILQVGLLSGSKAEIPLGKLLTKRVHLIGTALRSRPIEEKITLSRRFADEVLPLFEEGRLRPVIDRRYSLWEAAEAHRYMESNANFGKILLEVSE